MVLTPEAVVLEGRLVVNEPGTHERDPVRVRVEDGVITDVGAFDPGADGGSSTRGTLLPGLIDLQCNGCRGHSVDECTPEALDAIAHEVWRGGAAAFAPTLITAPFELLLQRVEAVARWIDTAMHLHAQPLGLHVEGPFLETPGTHDRAHFVDPTPERIDALLRAAGRHLKLVTLAPGRPGAAAAVARLRAAGVAVALGHGTGTDGLEACVEAGARMVTHLFNAMGPMHHREPGLAGLALDDARLTCSLIPDGVHVHETMVRNAYRCLGPERTILVTDAVAGAGMDDGDYRLSGQTIHLRGGVVRDDQGNLAGSALTMSEAAQRWLRMVPTADAAALARVASTNPARMIGATSFGSIAPGKSAFFTVIDSSHHEKLLSLGPPREP